MEVIGSPCAAGGKQNSRGERRRGKRREQPEDDKENRPMRRRMPPPTVSRTTGKDNITLPKTPLSGTSSACRAAAAGVVVTTNSSVEAAAAVHTSYMRYIRGCIGRTPSSSLSTTSSSSSSAAREEPLRDSLVASSNALKETLYYIQQRKRDIEKCRQTTRDPLNNNIHNSDLYNNNNNNKQDRSVELSFANYSHTVCEPALTSRIFSDSVLNKLGGGGVVGAGCDTKASISQHQHQQQHKASLACSVKSAYHQHSDKVRRGRDNTISAVELKDNNSSNEAYHRLNAVEARSAEQQQSGTSNDTSNLCVSHISDIGNLSFSHEQASSLDLAECGSRLHSTFSYPLHSTLRGEDDLFNCTVTSLHSKQDKTLTEQQQQQQQQQQVQQQRQQQQQQQDSLLLKSLKSDQSSVGLNQATMRTFTEGGSPSGISERLSITDVIRSTIKENIRSASSIASQNIVPMDLDMATRFPGDGCDMGPVSDDDSCDSSTLSFCVDEEPFEGDACQSPEPLLKKASCDVCKIMKRQKAVIDLQCQDSDNSDNSDSPKPMQTNQINCSQSPVQKLQRCIQASRSVLSRADPARFSPEKWSTSQNASQHSSKYGSPVSSKRLTPNSHADSSLSLDSSDSGRGSSYLSDVVSMESSRHSNSLNNNNSSNNRIPACGAVWHSTPHHVVAAVSNRKCSSAAVSKSSQDLQCIQRSSTPFTILEEATNTTTAIIMHTPKQRRSLERRLRDSTGKYLNTPVSKTTKSRRTTRCSNNKDVVPRCAESGSDYDRKAIKKKLRQFCKTFHQEDVLSNLQTLAHV